MGLPPECSWPATGGVIGSNRAAVQVVVDEAAGRPIAVAAIDTSYFKGTAEAPSSPGEPRLWSR